MKYSPMIKVQSQLNMNCQVLSSVVKCCQVLSIEYELSSVVKCCQVCKETINYM